MPTSNRERVAVVALGSLALVVVVIIWLAWRSPPQMGADEEVFRTVDALFTAVTGRSPDRLGTCAARLQSHRAAGKLPAAAADHLDTIIEQARGGNWEPAAQRLYDFMKSQRREGSVGQSEPRKPGKKS
jgi:hypothetical protein